MSSLKQLCEGTLQAAWKAGRSLSSTEGSDKVATGARFESTSVPKACQTQTQGSCVGECRRLVSAVQEVIFEYSRQNFQNLPKRAKETGALSPPGLCWHSWSWQKKPHKPHSVSQLNHGWDQSLALRVWDGGQRWSLVSWQLPHWFTLRRSHQHWTFYLLVK